MSINLLKEERQALGQIAVATDRSLGAVVRDLIIAGLRQQSPDIADQIDHARRTRRAAMLAVAVAVGAAAVVGIDHFSAPDAFDAAPIICIGE